jgi:integrase
LFKRACVRVGIKGVTSKDLRAKAATDATKQGYQEKQLQTALAHTDGATTRVYIRGREVSVSEVVLKLPM